MNDKETECADRLTKAILPIVKEIGLEATAALLVNISARFLETAAADVGREKTVN
jgi:hypothetical protein